VKFCPECGSQLPIGTAKFCPTCGEKLWFTKAEETTSSISNFNNSDSKQTVFSPKPEEEDEYFKEDSEAQEEKINNVASSIHSLGIKLEEMVEQILKSTGYSYTERRKKMIGNTSISHEIDVFAREGGKWFWQRFFCNIR
jgi:uncharacterized Zn finger protein (UPF0148 family)